MGHLAIRADGLSKRYRIGRSGTHDSVRDLVASALRGRIGLPGRRPAGDPFFWALRDVGFEVERGEVVGVIGRNGAGKSTLLKILSRITKPTSGEAEIRGRMSSLLEVGTGFHPELTGRENVFLNGAILGMSRAEIRRKFDEIVAFAEIGPFLDTPVKRYSSGMYVRLAFSVAAHLEPDILVVDEVLAVGDANFQKRCLNKMNDVAGHGRTVLFVSHNLGSVQALCRTAMLIDRGELRRSGPVRDVVAEYLSLGEATRSVPISERVDRTGEGRIRFRNLTILDSNGRPADFVLTGEDMSFQIELSTSSREGDLPVPLDLEIQIRDSQGSRITTLGSFFTGASPTRIRDGHRLVCSVPRLPLLADDYRLDLWCSISESMQDCLKDAACLRVEPGDYFRNTDDLRRPEARYHGSCMIPHRWGDLTLDGSQSHRRTRSIT